jgi:hypothetical protein
MRNSDKYSLLQFQAGYDVLMSQVKHFRLENELLKKEIISLKDKLNINSNSSSLPPSSDFKNLRKNENLQAENVEVKLVARAPLDHL